MPMASANRVCKVHVHLKHIWKTNLEDPKLDLLVRCLEKSETYCFVSQMVVNDGDDSHGTT